MKRKKKKEKTSYGKRKLKVQNFEKRERNRDGKKKKKEEEKKRNNSRNLCSSQPKEIRRRSKHVQTTFPPQSPSSPELIPR